MEIKGKVTKIMPTQSGISQSSGNNWMSQEFILDYIYWPNQTIPSRMVLRMFGEDRINAANLKEGDSVKVKFHVEAREYKGRWYNEVRCDSVDNENAKPPAQTAHHEAANTEKKEESKPEQVDWSSMEQQQPKQEEKKEDEFPF